MPDMSLVGFMAHLAAFEARLHHHSHQGLERAAKAIQAEAKHEIGTYQGEAGPFAAWAELADATKADRVAHGFSENEPLLRTGEMRDSIEYAVGHNEAAIGSNNQKAVWQELGTDRIPARSFLGGAAFRKAPEVAKELGGSVTAALVGHDVHEGRIAIPSS